jgi:hypothetical protein
MMAWGRGQLLLGFPGDSWFCSAVLFLRTLCSFAANPITSLRISDAEDSGFVVRDPENARPASGGENHLNLSPESFT